MLNFKTIDEFKKHFKRCPICEALLNIEMGISIINDLDNYHFLNTYNFNIDFNSKYLKCKETLTDVELNKCINSWSMFSDFYNIKAVCLRRTCSFMSETSELIFKLSKCGSLIVMNDFVLNHEVMCHHKKYTIFNVYDEDKTYIYDKKGKLLKTLDLISVNKLCDINIENILIL